MILINYNYEYNTRNNIYTSFNNSYFCKYFIQRQNKVMATADVKLKIIQLYDMKMDYEKIAIRTNKTVRYITKVIEEYHYDGTITVNSKLKNIKL